MASTVLRLSAVLSLTATLAACALPARLPARSPERGLEQIQTVVVLYAENHSFDNLYGLFPGADGIANARPEQTQQRDHDGRVLPTLPPVYHHGKVSERYPRGLPNGPFRIDAPPVNVRLDEIVPSPIHNFWQNQEQINGGRNDGFVAMSNVGAWVMGHYDGSQMKLWQWAREYTLADRFFMGAFGGSFLNHQWLICACTPRFEGAPDSLKPQLDAQGRLRKRPHSPASVMEGPVQVFDGTVTPDDYVVNTSQPPYQPSGYPPAAAGPRELADPARHPVPPQTARTIGDTLSAKGVDWAWYAGNWRNAERDGLQEPAAKRRFIYNTARGEPAFQPHHQPFNYFKRFAPGSPDRERHLRDGDDFLKDIAAGRLPPVSFYKPTGHLNQHPSYADVATGDAHLADVLSRLRASPQWKNMLVVLTYDENGGYWDHVAPPRGEGWGDRWGPGTRVPALIVSPFAKRGHVDSTPYDTTSILKFITRRFGLDPLPGVRERVGDLTGALTLGM